jgi:ubiquinone/menaquinone biosynthesis C-methylase UbiE
MALSSFLSELSDDPTASHIGRISENDIVRVDGYDLPFPAPAFMNYGQEVAGHISSGKRDFQLLSEIVDEHGIDGPILDFACANGRTLRWFSQRAQQQDIWGVDIDAKRISWCQNWLSPPFNFSVVTTNPHLPFEDRYFSFIYGYSIFTHLDELFMAWLCEMRRCLQLGGLLFVTICDETSFARQLNMKQSSSVKGFATNDPNTARFLEPETQVSYKRFRQSIFTHVKRDYFVKVCQPHLNLVGVFKGAMGVQTGLLLRRIK